MSTRLLDELALAGPEHFDPGYIANYDRKAAFDPRADIAILRERGLGADSTVLDLGAGTGTFALAVATECRRVIAVDVSPAMVAAMQAKLHERRVTNVDCVQAGFLTYDHSGGAVDFIYSRHALHHLPDFWKAVALQRIAAFLHPGGVLLLRDIVFAFDSGDAEACISAWLGAAATRTEEGWTREELEAHVRDEHSTFSWLLEPMIERAGLDIDRADHDPLKIYAHYICVSRRR